LDFSPSVGIDRLHPVPTSTDDGATLDWGGTLSEEDKADKKWTLSLTKRRRKDNHSPVLSRDAVERQEVTFSGTASYHTYRACEFSHNFTERISRIKSFAQPHTLKKAVITADQLRRRYAFLSNTLKTDPNAGNPILTVAKWNAGLDPIVQGVLEQAEPLTWLKHLRGKRPGRTPRFPWHVTALLFEERVRAQARLAAMAMETIPEDVLNSLDSPRLSGSPPEPMHSSPIHPSFAHTSRDRLHPSLSRRHSDDGHVSFEPIIEPSRRSIDESRHSSFYGGFFNGSRSHGASPSSSRVYLRDLASRVRRKGAESDEASSSHHSVSEDNGRADEPRKKGGKRRHFFRPPELDLVSRTQPNPHGKVSSGTDVAAEVMSSPGTAVVPHRELRTPGPDDILNSHLFPDQPQSALRLDTATTVVNKISPGRDRLLRGRVSLPSSPHHSWTEEETEWNDEEAEQEEYERRAE